MTVPHAGRCCICGRGKWRVRPGTNGGDYYQCVGCGIYVQGIIHPRSSLNRFEDQQRRFYTSDEFFASPLFLQLERDYVAQRLSVICRWLPKGRLLEVGPGTGTLLGQLVTRGYDVEAVEHSPLLAGKIRQKYGVPIYTGAFEQQTLPASAYSGVVSFHVIEHVPDVCGFIAKTSEIVRPGGYLVMGTPNAGSWEHRLAAQWSPNYATAHLQLFSVKPLALLLQKYGWIIRRQITPSYFDGWLRVATSVLRRLRGGPRTIAPGQLMRTRHLRTRTLVSAYRTLTVPLRRVQQACHGGNELLVVAQRAD